MPHCHPTSSWSSVRRDLGLQQAELAAWVKSGEATAAEAQAAAFVLEVASMSKIWEHVPEFKIHDAIVLWSREDRAAFAAWAKESWLI